MTISMPRNCVEVAHALVMLPFSACASIRRWPSMRVIGSTTTLVVSHGESVRGRGGRRRRMTGSSRARSVRGSDGRRSPRHERRRRRPRPRPARRRACRQCARRQTPRRWAAGRRTVSSCPRNSARCTRGTGGPPRSANSCGRSTGRSGTVRTSPAPCSPPCTGTTPCVPLRRRIARRTAPHRSGRAASIGRGCGCAVGEERATLIVERGQPCQT